MRFGPELLEGFIRDVSETGISVALRPGAPVELPVGGQVVVRFELPDQGTVVEGPAEVVWRELNDRDIDDRPAVGLGARLQIEAPGLSARLADFVAKFRYSVLVVGVQVKVKVVEQALGEEFRVLTAATATEALDAFGGDEVAVVLVGPEVAFAAALELFQQLGRDYPNSHAVRVIAPSELSVAQLRELVNRGHVFRALEPSFDAAALGEAVRAAVDRYAVTVENERLASELDRAKRLLERENSSLRQRVVGARGFDTIIGTSPALQETLSQTERIGRSEATVHITGETGTGKELVARALHARSPRAHKPYIVQNCAGMTETLIQSTLFGHRKGAFTGADRNHPGVFLEADGGTLFLDEVAELSGAMQAGLLRVLQEGEITPVGASRSVNVDVRVLSATHKDLKAEVQAGRFREDLYYRLVVLSVRLPPLRERVGDIALLARHFLAQHCERYDRDIPGFSSDAMAALEGYSWPGNVRELDNEIERVVVLAESGERVRREMLSAPIAGPTRPPGASSSAPVGLGFDAAVERLQRNLITDALDASDGSISKAADRLGMERSRLGKLRVRLGLANE